MNTWLKDSNGNKCSVEYFGSKEAAREIKALLIKQFTPSPATAGKHTG